MVFEYTQLYFVRDYSFCDQNPKSVDEYIADFFKHKPHLENLNNEVKRKINLRWKSIIEIFNENLKKTSFSIILLRKNSIPEEVEIFKAYPNSV